jgi:hypothetical protein
MSWLRNDSKKTLGVNCSRNGGFGGAFITVFILLLSAPGAWAAYGGGSGTAGDPYLINTPAQMNTIGLNQGDWDKHFKLVADIDMSAYTGESYNIIGYYISSDDQQAFTGVFDGNGHAISNFTYVSSATEEIWDIGLFGFVDGENADIKNLGLVDPNVYAPTAILVGAIVGDLKYAGIFHDCYVDGGSVSGEYTVGGLAGRSLSSTITIYNCHAISCSVSAVEQIAAGVTGKLRGNMSKCYAVCEVTSGSGDAAGGLVGINWGAISYCHASCNVSGRSDVGGLVASNNVSATLGRASISNCYATGTASGSGGGIGGLAGSNMGTISQSFASGNVVATFAFSQEMGGLVGWNYGGPYSGATADGRILNCYATGPVEGASNSTGLGGLVGENDGALISKCYSVGRVSGGSFSIGGLVGTNLNGGTVSSSFWDVQTSGQGGSAGGTGKTTAQMQTWSTFTSAGWDFTDETANGTDDIWRMCVNGTDYSLLAWQRWPLGDYYCPDGSDFKDYAVLAGQWRQAPSEPSADIAPDIRDGIVSGLDLRKLCDNWLSE